MSSHLNRRAEDYSNLVVRRIKTRRGYLGIDDYGFEVYDADEEHAIKFTTRDGAWSASIRTGGKIEVVENVPAG